PDNPLEKVTMSPLVEAEIAARNEPAPLSFRLLTTRFRGLHINKLYAVSHCDRSPVGAISCDALQRVVSNNAKRRSAPAQNDERNSYSNHRHLPPDSRRGGSLPGSRASGVR